MARPDSSTIIYCVDCRRPKNGKGWFGPGCQCDRPKGDSMKGAPSVGTRRGA